jgi:hypothetical protein
MAVVQHFFGDEQGPSAFAHLVAGFREGSA